IAAVVLGPLSPQVCNVLCAVLTLWIMSELKDALEYRVVLREIKYRVELAAVRALLGEAPEQRVIAVERLAEHEELVLPSRREPRPHRLGEIPPKFVFDVLHGVDAETVEIHLLDPRRVRVDHLVTHGLYFRRDVLQSAREVSEHSLRGIVVIEDTPHTVI